MSDLIQRLRGNYTIPIRDGAGPLDGKMEFHRDFPTVPIQLEAADALEAKDAEIAVLCEHLICELCEKPAEHFTVCPECYAKVARKPASVPVEALKAWYESNQWSIDGLPVDVVRELKELIDRAEGQEPM